jgi:hypothetical protein
MASNTLAGGTRASPRPRRSSLSGTMKRRSTIAFLMALPLILPVRARNLLDGGVAELHLRDHRGDLQGADRLHGAHRAQHPAKGQRKWRGMLLVPWVIPPALSTLGWWWLFDPSYSAINWMLNHLGARRVPWLGDPGGRASRSSWSTSGTARPSS